MFGRILTKIVIFTFCWLVLWSIFSKVRADSVLILHASYGNTETNIGSRLLAEGHSVTYSTGGVPSSVSSYQQIFDLRYNNAYSASEITVLNNFVKNGGFLMMNGENSGFATRNNSIASVISTLGGGTLTFGSGNNSYTVINSKFTNDTGTITGAAGSSLINSKGQYVFKDTSGNIGGMIWQAADLGSGYSGAVFVTADINMWDSTYGSTLLKVNILDDIIDMETAGTLYGSVTPQYSSAPTNEQLQFRTDMRNINPSGNSIYIDSIGDHTTVTINQYGNGNLIAGTSTTSTTNSDATITGDYNTVNIQQGYNGNNNSGDNVLLFDITGNHNNLTVEQGNNILDTGGHRAETTINGNYNDLNLYQYNTGYGSGQTAQIGITGNDNSIISYQRDTDKMLFVNITGSNSTVTTNQKDSGNHFLDITLGSNQTVTTTQEGSGSHAATIDMGGYSAGLSLSQSGSTSQTYSLNQTCINPAGCGTTTVNQQ